MEIIVAQTAGFCFGVKRAVDTVYDNINIAQNKTKIYTLGPIIHNQQVIKDLESKNVFAIDSLDNIEKDAKVIIRTHGIPKSTYQELEDKKIQYIDATCPYVKKIHRIVEQFYKDGYQIVIVGDPNHPEVIGINGWCDNTAVIVQGPEDIMDNFKCANKTCIVAQTTISRERWDKITQYFKNNCQNPVIFDTICSATNLRQSEAEKIAKQVDMMIVIGGKHSSNTQKLYSICKQFCSDTYFIETFEDLPQDVDYRDKKIGITAGASTPVWIIKEVIKNMEEKSNVQVGNADLDFAEAFEQSLITLNTGDTVKGTVIGMSSNEVYVDLGFKSDGIIRLSELTDDPTAVPEDIVKIGDVIDVFVIRVDDGEGNVLLSKKKLDSIRGWESIENAFEKKEVLQGKIIEVVNGGVIVLVNGIKVFVPASHVSDRYVSDLNVFLKDNVSLQIIDVNKRKRRAVGSIRNVIVEEKERKAQMFWSTAEVGKKYTGTVKKITDFGAFVDIGGVDGLIHISELSWNKIKHPSEVLKEGDIVEVYIIELDKEKKRISLGYKKAEDNPWVIAKNKFNVGDVVKCKVVRLVPFGAFVELIPGVDGLIHISQISNRRIGKPADVLSIGEEIEAKIIEMDLDNQKISLSRREVLNAAEAPAVNNEKKADDQPQPNEDDVK
ncbi:MAG: bifunctional 4-hydroxy-3-methylbut-2-enyl diphosphate reductase/30S ribosomal protein S1 [Clostridiaceae bacterium]|nr:bifunctional 4-hydroxy-3-methylbut-2-enyl diphosphate reductase/30S ribosomal protein S1 [Clostridiaceae bacterium]